MPCLTVNRIQKQCISVALRSFLSYSGLESKGSLLVLISLVEFGRNEKFFDESSGREAIVRV